MPNAATALTVPGMAGWKGQVRGGIRAEDGRWQVVGGRRETTETRESDNWRRLSDWRLAAVALLAATAHTTSGDSPPTRHGLSAFFAQCAAPPRSPRLLLLPSSSILRMHTQSPPATHLARGSCGGAVLSLAGEDTAIESRLGGRLPSTHRRLMASPHHSSPRGRQPQPPIKLRKPVCPCTPACSTPVASPPPLHSSDAVFPLPCSPASLLSLSQEGEGAGARVARPQSARQGDQGGGGAGEDEAGRQQSPHRRGRQPTTHRGG